MSARSVIKSLTPPAIWSLVLAAKYGPLPKLRVYQGVTTEHNMARLHTGEFGKTFDAAAPLDPNLGQDVTRLRQYHACLFADYARRVPGDFLSAGISYGVAPKVVYELVRFEQLRPKKTYHLIDSFEGFDGTVTKRPTYNTDPAYVRRQYPDDASVHIHRSRIPDCFPIAEIDALAFVHLNTGVPRAEAESLPYLYERLSAGGVIVIDKYAFGEGNMDVYDPTIERLGASVFSLVSGQGVIIKAPHAL